MSRFRLSSLLILALLFGARPVLAATVAVGSCRPNLPSYPNISAAVAAVSAGSIVLVCPGTYSEQVIVATPLTLQGISSGNSAQAIVTVPGTGLATTSGVLFNPLAPQVEVTATGGPVNIINLTVDGSAGASACSGAILIGIYYGSGSFGTVNEVTVRNAPSSCGAHGVLAENGTATGQFVTIQNSSVHDTVNGTGILVDSNQSPGTFTATIKGNQVSNTYSGILQYTGAGPGSITGNVVSATNVAVGSLAPSVVISANVLTSPSSSGVFGAIYAGASGVSVTSNKVWNTPFWGIQIATTGATIRSNFISDTNVAIEFACNTGNIVSANTINDAVVGFDNVPLVSTPSSSFFNVATNRTDGCGFAALSPSAPSQETITKIALRSTRD